jgi:transcription initiation factor TFIIB
MTDLNDSTILNLDDEGLFDLLENIDYEKEKDEIKKIEIGYGSGLLIKENELSDRKNYCGACNTEDQIFEDFTYGISVCKNCGNVIATLMDKTPEWKQYNDGGEYSKEVGRCSSMPTNHFFPQSSIGTSISGSNRSKIKILHSWSAMPYKERSLYIILKKIQTNCEKANIVKCIEDDAKILCKNISECKHIKGVNKGKKIIIRGRNRESLIAACVFYACKKKGETRSPKEIAKIFGLKYTEITKGCKTFLKLMKIRNMDYHLNSSRPEHFIPRFCAKLKMSDDIIKKTVQIAKNIQRLNIASVHTPLSVATGAILLVADLVNLKIPKKSIAETFGVTEVTISKTFKKLTSYKNIILDDVLTEKIFKLIEIERKAAKMPEKFAQKYRDIQIKNGTKLKEDVDENIKEDEDIIDIEEFDEYDEYDEYEEFEDDHEIDYNFDFKNDNIDDYINYINIELYDQFDKTNNCYKTVLSDFYRLIINKKHNNKSNNNNTNIIDV